MDISFRQVGNTPIIVFALGANDMERSSESRKLHSELNRHFRTQLYKYSGKRLAPHPNLIFDFSRVDITREEFDQWLRTFYLLKPSTILMHRGKTVACGIKGRSSLCDVYEDMEAAIEGLVSSTSPTDLDGEISFGRHVVGNGIHLVGCPDNDIHELVDDFAQFGIHAKIGLSNENTPNVIFCLSITNGLSSGTKSAISNCLGKTFRPLCIILTSSLLMEGDSLSDLAEYELKEVLSTVMEADLISGLPVLMDLDPTLISKVVELANSSQRPHGGFE